MPQIFHRSTNSFSRVSIFGAVFIIAGVLSIFILIQRSPYVTYVGVAREQPVQFSHLHHVGDDGIDCRYCHLTVEVSNTAGIPSTEVCMNCHSQIWADAPSLAPVRQSWQTNTPIEWVRVHDMPDYVYFNHSIHINKGVGCDTCHGRLDQMNGIWKNEPMSMEWCMECHFNPEKYIRPRDQVFNLHYQYPANQLQVGAALVREYNIESLISCSTCHR